MVIASLSPVRRPRWIGCLSNTILRGQRTDDDFIVTAFVVIDKVMAALGHRDNVRARASDFDWTAFGPLALDAPQLQVDTTRSYAPSLDASVAFCRSHAPAQA